MATVNTFNIPLTTIAVGVTSLPPAPIPVGATQSELLLDRNVGAQPLDGDPGARLTLEVDVSQDNGATWQMSCSEQVDGGVIINPRTGTELTQQPLGCGLFGDPNSTARMARATITSNAQVTVSGTLTLS